MAAIFMKKSIEQFDFFPEDAGALEKKRIQERRRGINPGEIRRKRNAEQKRRIGQWAVDEVGRMVDRAEQKERERRNTKGV